MATGLCSMSKSKVQKFEKIVPQNLTTYEKSFGIERFGRIFFSVVCVTHEKKLGSERVNMSKFGFNSLTTNFQPFYVFIYFQSLSIFTQSLYSNLANYFFTLTFSNNKVKQFELSLYLTSQHLTIFAKHEFRKIGKVLE